MKSCLHPICLGSGWDGRGLDLETQIEVASKAGFEGLELLTPQILEFLKTHSTQETRKLFNNRANPTIMGAGRFIFISEDQVASSFKNLQEICEVAYNLGVNVILADTLRSAPFDKKERQRAIKRTKDASSIAEGYGINIVFEFIGVRKHPAPPQGYSPDIWSIFEMIDEAGVENVGALFDTYHWYCAGLRPQDLDRVEPRRIMFVHINDAPEGRLEELVDPMRVLMGQGKIDLKGILTKLKEKGYGGYVSVEINKAFNKELKDLSPFDAACRCKKALDNILAKVKGM